YFFSKYQMMSRSATTMEINVASAAPVTPSFGHGPMPKIKKGASTIFRITLTTWKMTGAWKIPVARKAEPIETRGNCSNIAGRNQTTYALANPAVTGSALSELA